MTVTPVVPQPFVMKDCLVQFGATASYEQAVTEMTLTPSASVVTQAALAPGAVYSDTTPATWTLVMSFLQDWEDDTSLGRVLFDSEGDELALTFKPKDGGATSVTVNVIATPGAIGGAIGAYAIAQVTLGCTGKPVFGP